MTRHFLTFKESAGFTLLESLVAVTILTISIAGPLLVANRSIVAARVARDQLTASYLAQEGIEYIRAMRDDRYLAAYQVGGPNVSTTAWTNFKNNPTILSCRVSSSGLGNQPFCTYDSTAGLQSCSGACNKPLYLTPSGVYTQTIPGNNKTAFTRRIQTVSITGNEERIVSTVTWGYHGTTYAVTINEHLTPWQ